MPDRDSPSDTAPIGLTEMIESLRLELQRSLESGKGRPVAFDVEKVELELKVAVTRKSKGEGGIAFWVVKAGAALEAGHDSTHTFKLTLLPQLAETGTRLKISAAGEAAASRG